MVRPAENAKAMSSGLLAIQPRKGFTLVETLIAIAIVLILAALVIAGLSYSANLAKEAERANWRDQRRLDPVLGTDKLRVSILFIGNSLTDVNNLPRMVQVLGQSDGFGRTIHVVEKQASGFSFQNQWNDPLTVQMIKSEAWDFVVLQDQGQEPWANPQNMWTYAQKLNDVIVQDHSVTMFYLTFARQDELNYQQQINLAYFDMARKLGAEVAVVGPAWTRCMQELPQLKLYNRDQIHPLPAGSYLAASVFYAAIFGRNPTGLPAEIKATNGTTLVSLDTATARALQQIAWKTTLDERSRWMTPFTRTSQAAPLLREFDLLKASSLAFRGAALTSKPAALR